MKKILLVHNTYRNTGGEDIAVKNEARFLKKHFNVEELYFENIINNPFSQFLYFFSNNNLKSKKIIQEKIQEFQPDVIYIHNTWFKASLSVIKESIRSNKKVILKLHNFRYFCTKSFFAKDHFRNENFCNACGLSKSSMGFYNKYFVDSVFKSIFMSIYGYSYFNWLKKGNFKIAILTNFHKNFLNSLGISNERLFVFPNFIKSQNNDSTKNKSNVLVYAGRISEEKGVENLINSFNSINSHDYKLKIIGEGPLKNSLKEKYSSEKVLFYDFMNNKKVLNEIKDAKGIVTATKLFEGQPTLLCEASSLGIPSVFPRTGGISEFFPQSYKYSFKQFDYDDLTVKLNDLIIDLNSLNIGNQNKIFIERHLGEDKLINKFKDMINS